MSPKKSDDRSVTQLVANQARERKLSREDGFTTYVMDRLLYRLGRSSQAKEFFLKGGILVANLVNEPYRFTRDIDTARSRGPCDPDDIRSRFREIVRVDVDDAVVFDPDDVRATVADRDADGYDGIKVKIRASLGPREVDIQIDVGFGDAVIPSPIRTPLQPFLEKTPEAKVYAYTAATVVAEKVETIIAKFPAIAHRLKDILDVVVMAHALDFDGEELVKSMLATFDRRRTRLDLTVLDEMPDQLSGKKWTTDWATSDPTNACKCPSSFQLPSRTSLLSLVQCWSPQQGESHREPGRPVVPGDQSPSRRAADPRVAGERCLLVNSNSTRAPRQNTRRQVRDAAAQMALSC